MAYQRIVVGTDGSRTARIAERAAVRLAVASAAELLIVTAYEPGGGRQEWAEEVLEGAAARAKEGGVEANTVARPGDPSDVVNEFADMVGADLIVVGSVGMGQARRFRLGGVPDRISHYAPCDLLIVQTTAPDAESREPVSYGRVLIATDGSSTADEASRRGAMLAGTVGAPNVDLVFVGDALVGQVVVTDTAKRLGLEEAGQHVVKGDPSKGIVKTAESEAADLVVVGNKGMLGAKRYLTDSVPNRVSHNAPCDVLIVKTVGRSPDELGPGEAGIVLAAGRKLAAYRDEAGVLHAVTSRCTHLGCTVGWNDGDKTWDCPCHGSRYDKDGKVIQGPAEENLTPVAIKEG